MIKKDFAVNVDGKDIQLSIMTPNAQDRKEAQKVYNTAFSDALKSGAIVRAKLDDILVEQGLWNESKQIEFETIQKKIGDCEQKLERGGIPLSAARQIALEMRSLRAQFREIISDKTSLDTHSAEGQADTERFNYLVYACTYHKDTKNRYFKSYKEYQEAGDDIVSVEAAGALANLMYGLEADYEGSLPENKFLKEYKFVDENLRFINKEGKFTDVDGRLVDENGRYIDKDGNFVDKYGNSVDAAGNFNVEFKPFTDDDGNPVEVATSETKSNEPDTKPSKPARKKSSKKQLEQTNEV